MADLPLVIVNPASAGGATTRRWPAIASAFRAHFGPFECVFTTGVGDGARIASRESGLGRRLIVACGGDGTVSEIANGIIESGRDTELAVLPSGTGGDFRRSLGLSARPADAALALRSGTGRLIDVGRVTSVDDTGQQRSRYFVNVSSFGLSGAVVRRIRDNAESPTTSGISSFAPGALSYAVAAVQTWPRFKTPLIELQLDDEPPLRLKLSNLCVSNARYFGGGMKIAPDARLDDGRFDIVAIGDISALTLLTSSYRIYLGSHLGLDEVRHRHAARVSASRVGEGDAVRLEADGELAGQLPASFEIIPAKLRVRWPAGGAA